MNNLIYLSKWNPELYITLKKDDIHRRYIDFNRVQYFNLPRKNKIIRGECTFANRDELVNKFKNEINSIINTYAVESIISMTTKTFSYICWCDKNKLCLFTELSLKQYSEYLYQRVQRKEIKRSSYCHIIHDLKFIFSLLGYNEKYFDNILLVSKNDQESNQSYSRSDLKKILPLLRALFKQTATQFLENPEKHKSSYISSYTMTFEWNGKKYKICSGISKMMVAATYLMAYYTSTNTTQLFTLKRPKKAGFSIKDEWYTMPVFKRRSFKIIHVEIGQHNLNIPKYCMNFFDTLLKVSTAIDNSKDALLFQLCITNDVVPISSSTLSSFNQRFIRRYHPMTDDRGNELLPKISRFRQTGSQLSQINQGELASSIILGNTPNVIQKHYTTGNHHDNNKMLQETISIRYEQARTKESIKKIKETLHISTLTYEEYLKKLSPNLKVSANGTYCSDPFGNKSKIFNKRSSKYKDNLTLACADLLACFGCEHQVIIQSVDDIWCLLSFKENLEESLYLHIDSKHYEDNFKKTIDFINNKILPKLDKKLIKSSNYKLVNEGRHPLWKDIDSMILS